MSIKRKSLIFSVFTVLFVSLICTTAVTAQATAAASGNPVAEEYFGPEGVDFSPTSGFLAIKLTLSFPSGVVASRTFTKGKNPYFYLSDPFGCNVTDGLFAYELRAYYSEDPNSQARDPECEGLFTPKAVVQAGFFYVERGKIVSREEEEEGQSAKARKEAAAGNRSPGDNLSTSTNELSTTQDICYNDDLIVDGSLCVGFDCTCNYSFGFDTIVLKENNLRIFFDDTSTAASFPRNDWRIVINDSANGGASYFGVEDATGGRRPFTVEAGARSHSLYVDDGGRIGIRTSTPSTEIHVIDGDTPTLRLQQDGSSGFAPQTWDVAGNETNFFIRDVTNGSQLPFRIRPDAPTSSIFIDTDGSIGLGTSSPSSAMHLKTPSGTNAQFLLERTSGSTGTFTGGNSGVNIGSQSSHEVRLVTNAVVRTTWDTSGGLAMATGGGSYDETTGQWVDGSSREYKENIADLSAENAIAAIKELKPVTFKFKNNKDDNDRQVGFIAEDVPELVATKTRKGLSSMDIVAVLTKVVQEQQKLVDMQQKQMSEQKQQMSDQQKTISELKKRIEQIEKESK